MVLAISCDRNGAWSIDTEYLPVWFLCVHEHLPANAPSDHAHVIDMALYKPSLPSIGVQCDVKIQDAVATLLFNISKATLDQFLDSQTTSFKFLWSFKREHVENQMIVWRQGAQVLVGQFVEYPEDDELEWDNLVRCRINYDGSWDLASATFGRYTRLGLHHAWAESFLPRYTRMGIEHDKKKGEEQSARTLGDYILSNECWIAKAESKWNIEISMAR
ncbi:hypothetical protein J4E83_005520 [Alternaria metachromatica]|uniref:uncharacterized protein n=1 Tax=Alternaria metachromatica TaxID=283354 RepID=UPI0020C37DB3|nr:uncharacterized protein J4E83_005520 [Alternaria metachromatica]KAI4619665.1 hypothetical protein J4E83_005520 [Alternaria metachromatica]